MTLVSGGVVVLVLVALIAGVVAQITGYPALARWLAGGALAVLAALVLGVALAAPRLQPRRSSSGHSGEAVTRPSGTPATAGDPLRGEQ